MLFLVAYLAACLLQRMGMLLRRWGAWFNTRGSGYPWLMVRETRIDEVFFKIWVEPLLVIIGGVLLIAVDRALGSYIATAGFALYLKGRMVNLLNSSQTLDMRDAMLEQEQRAERFREMNGDLIDSIRGRSDRSPWR